MEYRLILAEEAEGRVANLFRTTSSRRISLVCERCADNWGFLTTYDVHSELKIPFMSPFPVAIICKLVLIPKSNFGQQSSFVCKERGKNCTQTKYWINFGHARWPIY